MIALGHSYLSALGLRQWRLVVNFMGTPADRTAYAAVLQEWLRPRVESLAPDDAAKVESHPPRVLDSKRPETRTVLAEAPRMVDHLDAASVAHGERVQAGLQQLGIDFEVDETLVRGLDYYTHTLFEFRAWPSRTPSHDPRRRALRRPHRAGRWPAHSRHRIRQRHRAGAAQLRRGEGAFDAPGSTVVCFVVDTTGGEVATAIAQVLRDAGVATDRAFDQRSMKSQMKAASKSGADFVIIGEDEKAAGTVTIRDLTAGEQTTVDLDTAVDHIRKVLDT